MAIKNSDLLPLFDDLKAMLAVHADRFDVLEPEAGRYELWSDVDIAPEGKKTHRPFFAGLIIQKSYVGLYFMPLFSDPEIASRIGSELMATFKGRTGFHIGSLTPTLRSQIESALSVGLDLYESRKWA